MSRMRWLWTFGLVVGLMAPVSAREPKTGAEPVLDGYFPPAESQGGWRTLLPERGEPTAEQKSKIRAVAGVDWDRLQAAWEHNAAAPGTSGMLVIRRGHVVGEWYKEADRKTDFLIFSSSKSYTSTAFGLILDEFGGKLADGRKLTLDTKVCNERWIPESLPLPDPRKADITVRHLLNMTSGVGPEPVPADHPYETVLGHRDGPPAAQTTGEPVPVSFAQLKGDPGTVFNYSNAGVSHLVLLFNHATGSDLFPFLKPRLLDPIGIEQIRWQSIGGGGAIGPYNQGYSGIFTTPREHARFCYLALHKGDWNGRRIVPSAYYDFAWTGTRVKPDYGAQWWVTPRVPGAPDDLAMTLGRDNNDGFVIPSLDLVFVRLGAGTKYPKEFKEELVRKVLASVEK
jgi:CubicO group peptidase (beta-lactamase class C family)